MASEIGDVRTTMGYGYPHHESVKALPFGLFLCLLGTAMLGLVGPSDLSARTLLAAVLALLFTALGIASFFFIQARPNHPQLILAPEGILYRHIPNAIIPWRVITGVDIARVSFTSRELLPGKAIRIAVPKAFYDRVCGRYFARRDIIRRGAEVLIVIFPQMYSTTAEELFEAIDSRRHAFASPEQNRAPRTQERPAPAVPRGSVPVAGSADLDVTRHRAIMERVQPAPIPGDPEGDRMSASLGGPRLAVTIALAACLLAIVLNIAGGWSTPGQIAAREEQRKWDEWNQRQREEQRRVDELLKRQSEEWERFFRRF